MNRLRCLILAASLLPLPCQSAMYKWVDEKGVTHYGDRVPPQYADRAGEALKKATRTAKPEARPVETRAPEPDPEKQKLEARQQLERQRQDNTLLATYADESEIDLARERELRRNSDTLKHSTAGLARSSSREDKRRLEALVEQSRQETDAINARFDAHKARFRELMAARSGARTAQASR